MSVYKTSTLVQTHSHTETLTYLGHVTTLSIIHSSCTSKHTFIKTTECEKPQTPHVHHFLLSTQRLSTRRTATLTSTLQPLSTRQLSCVCDAALASSLSSLGLDILCVFLAGVQRHWQSEAAGEAGVIPGQRSQVMVWDMCRGVSMSSKAVSFKLAPRRLAS